MLAVLRSFPKLALDRLDANQQLAARRVVHSVGAVADNHVVRGLLYTEQHCSLVSAKPVVTGYLIVVGHATSRPAGLAHQPPSWPLDPDDPALARVGKHAAGFHD